MNPSPRRHVGLLLCVIAMAMAAAVGALAADDAGTADVSSDAGADVSSDAGSDDVRPSVDAGSSSAPAPTPEQPPLPPLPTTAPTAISDGVVVVVADQPTPLVFHLPLGNTDERQRATNAGHALRNALELRPVDGAPRAEVLVADDAARIRIWGRTVATFNEADARAAGYPSLTVFGEQLETRLLHFVAGYEERRSLQQLAFHIFFSVFLCLLGLLTLRGIGRAFVRFDAAVESRELRPLVLLGVPVLSSDAVRGLLATAMVFARVVAVAGVIVVVVGASLAQFDTTRPLLELEDLVGQVLGGSGADKVGHGPRPSLIHVNDLLSLIRIVVRFGWAQRLWPVVSSVDGRSHLSAFLRLRRG